MDIGEFAVWTMALWFSGVLTESREGIKTLSKRAKVPEKPFTLVIEMDAWNIRERDHWGESEKLRKQGIDPSRWHWVYTGTIFRLDQRGTSETGRSVITERGYVATRGGPEALEKQVYRSAQGQDGLQERQSA